MKTRGLLFALLLIMGLAGPLSAQDVCYDTCQNWVCDTGWYWVDDWCESCNWVCDWCSDCWWNCDEEGNCWEECSGYECNCRNECSNYVCGGHWESYPTNCRWEEQQCNPHPCPPPPAWCGDGACNNGEDCNSCAADCGECPPPPPPPQWCGDGACNSGEDCASCAQDCGACVFCGNGVCDLGTGEDCGTCPGDCPCWDPNFPVCENRQCVAAPPPPPPAPFCGNGVCDPGTGEDCGTCLQDCPCWDPSFPVCENRQCVAAPPPPPPPPTCGNGVCDLGTGEDCGTCLQDCPCWDPNFPVCENRQCVAAPPPAATCGNGICDLGTGEDCGTCLQDCPCWDPNLPVCENRQCVAAPPPPPPPPAACGNRVPDPGEDCQTCPDDVALRPGFTVSPSTVRLGQEVTFIADSSQVLNPPVPLWDLGNAEHLEGATLTYTYPQPGTFGVVMTSTESACATPRLSGPQTVTVLPELSCDFSDIPPQRQVCCGNKVCDSGENPRTCPADCPTVCGDTFCVPSRGETPTSCPQDCCASQTTCPAGCAALPTFSISNPGPVVREIVTFTAFPDGIAPGTAVNWDFGDGSHCLQCGLSVPHEYLAAGDMQVRLTATERVCLTSQVSNPQFIRVFDRAVARGDAAAVVGSTLPGTLACNATQEVTVTMQNVGNTTWTSEAGYALGAVGDEDPFSAAGRIPLPGPVAPLERVTFTFTLNGGTSNGTFLTDWRMVRENVAWFGATAQSQVTVPAAPGCGLEATGNDIELILHCGERRQVQLQMRNTGTVPWTPEEDFALTLVGGDPLSDQRRIPVASTVAPGAQGEVASFDLEVTAPTTARSVTAFWRMVRGEEPFGATISQDIDTIPGPGCDPPVARGFLDNGMSIHYDNLSSMSAVKVEALIRMADRSTRTACVNNPNKGLFDSQDRIVVTDHYLAWLDYSTNEGVPFPAPPESGPAYVGAWERSGALAGFWSLLPAADPELTDFRYKTNVGSCAWPHNQLLPGSASPNGGLTNNEKFFWDKFSPPSEQCAVVRALADQDFRVGFFCHHYARQNGNSGWGSDGSVDGTRDAQGRLHYKTRGRLANAFPAQESGRSRHSVDVFDGNDANGIQNFIESSVEYVFSPEDIRLIWDIRPANATVVASNAFMYLWASYGQNEDDKFYGTTPSGQKLWCDQGRAGADNNERRDWPDDGAVPDQPLFAKSSETLRQNWGPGTSYPSGQVAFLELGPACPPDDQYINRDLFTSSVSVGSWLAMGASGSVSASSAPRWVFSHEGTPGSGDGSEGNPKRIIWPRLDGWNEVRDGSIGFGVDKLDGDTLSAGLSYRGEYCIGVASACGRGPGQP